MRNQNRRRDGAPQEPSLEILKIRKEFHMLKKAMLIAVFISPPAFSASFPADIWPSCAHAGSRLAAAGFEWTLKEHGSAFSFQFKIKPLKNISFKASEVSATLSCMKRSRGSIPGGTGLYLSADYDHLSVQRSPSMRSLALPEQAVVDILGRVLGVASDNKSQPTVLASCLKNAMTKPSDKFVNGQVDERTFIHENKRSYECTRRVQRFDGSSTFLFETSLDD